MDAKLQQKLYGDFPSLYRQKDLPAQQTCMCWGVCCGNGWYDILRRLSEKLAPLGVEACQVKEKFGGLRYYIDYGTANKEQFLAAQELIQAAETESMKTCEICGRPGKTTSAKNTWVRTLCNECA